MSIRISQLGSPREPDEGLRIGTVRRPPRGVPKAKLDDWYDVWLPQLAPSAELVKTARAAASPREWEAFVPQVPRGDGGARQRQAHHDARGALADHEFLGRLLLRGRGALSPLRVARAARGRRRTRFAVESRTKVRRSPWHEEEERLRNRSSG